MRTKKVVDDTTDRHVAFVDPTTDHHIAFKSDAILADTLSEAALHADDESDRYPLGSLGREFNRGQAAGLRRALLYLKLSQQ